MIKRKSGGQPGHKVSQKCIDTLKRIGKERIGTHWSGMSGKKHTPEWFAWRKTQKSTPESRKKVSESLKKAYRDGRHKRHFLKGKKMPEELRLKIQAGSPKGDKCHWWKGGITPTYKLRRKANLLKNGGHHSRGEWELCKAQYNWTCVLCGKKEPEIKLTKDHIIPVNKGGSNNIENIQPACQPCNSRKNDM